FIAFLANLYYQFPSKNLTVIGVTGTDGKTTTTNLIYHILHTAGLPVSMVSTVGAVIHGQHSDTGFHVTTPSSFAVQKFMKRSLSGNEKQYMVLEVTSHSLDQQRVWGIPFEIGVLTNITHEHLDYHKTYENYVKTKAKLLQKAKVAIINIDDISYPLLSSLISKKIITYGIKKKADVMPKTLPYTSSMEGGFQQYNELAAISVAMELGISDKIIKKALSTFALPKGRLEVVYDKDFTIIVDFAHTPNAFAQLLPVLKKQAKGRLIHVFGSAGQRDASKRPEMGRVSSEFADVSIVTAEDPRKEKIKDIAAAILSGMKKKNEVLVIEDRKQAIKKAISLAKKGDIVVLTGKGHEKSMNYGKGEIAWDEFLVVKEAIKKR
ncbi:MAG TPA: UDP-N-acetylmuramoyl-L-alanyl-D-glutamate--2,6-diaminopimelate ligase, partial [Patescibacteria group bacterium]|nr:UDP-N-acetylmuramoyl-L-alanyl-D-glutamate--2,6-diaminopimelate ligase [Patescibacteria group bacterium]